MGEGERAQEKELVLVVGQKDQGKGAVISRYFFKLRLSFLGNFTLSSLREAEVLVLLASVTIGKGGVEEQSAPTPSCNRRE